MTLWKTVFLFLLINGFGLPSWSQSRLQFHSNALLRYENQEFPDSPPGRESVDRYRIRWRPELLFQIHPDAQIGIEAEANWINESDDDVRPPRFPEFHTPAFDRDNFKRDAVVLSKAFVRYLPSQKFFIVAGKFDNPFLTSELLWDDDLRANGAALSASYESPAGSNSLTLRAADFYASHYLHDRTNVLAVQGIFQATTGAARWTFASTYYDHNVDELGTSLVRTNTRSGATVLNDYNLLDMIARIRINLLLPLRVQVDYVVNTAKETFIPTLAGNGDQGLLAEFFVGNIEKPHGFRLGYAYHRVESDAVFAAYNTDDWWFPTRGEGYRLRGSFKPIEHMILSLSYLKQTLIGQEAEFKRLQVSAEIDWPE